MIRASFSSEGDWIYFRITSVDVFFKESPGAHPFV